MIEFTVLDGAGNVVRYGTCFPETISQQANPGETVVEGVVRHVPDQPQYNYTYYRMQDYPEVGAQLDAIFKMAKALEAQGIELPADALEWIAKVQAVKDTYPKGGA